MTKKYSVFLVVLLLTGLTVSQPAMASITRSLHDFSKRTWNTEGEICKACHTPHNATSSITPLWNHTLTTATFTVYSSPSLNATVGQPSSASKVCLSCHDGTVAVDSFGSRFGSSSGDGKTEDILKEFSTGTDLSNDHPISFTYDAALATVDEGLHDPTVQTVGSLGGKTIDAGMLINHKLECSSCHDVHRNKGDSSITDRLLLVSNTKSGLCLTCHNK